MFTLSSKTWKDISKGQDYGLPTSPSIKRWPCLCKPTATTGQSVYFYMVKHRDGFNPSPVHDIALFCVNVPYIGIVDGQECDQYKILKYAPNSSSSSHQSYMLCANIPMNMPSNLEAVNENLQPMLIDKLLLLNVRGGAASSLVGGGNDAELDFGSVQRENPEMQRRCQGVIDACVDLGEGGEGGVGGEIR